MYPGKVNSPVAVLTASINESSTDIKVSAFFFRNPQYSY